jgi:hypothetical protein
MPNISQKWIKSINTGIKSNKNPKLYNKKPLLFNFGRNPLLARPWSYGRWPCGQALHRYALAPLSGWLLVFGA